MKRYLGRERVAASDSSEAASAMKGSGSETMGAPLAQFNFPLDAATVVVRVKSGDSLLSPRLPARLISASVVSFSCQGLRLAEQLGQREEEAKIRHRLGLSLWAGGNLEEAQHQVCVCEKVERPFADINCNLMLILF